MDLTPEELALLEKMHLNLDDLLKPKATRAKADSKAPKTIDLSVHSGIIKTVCKCCLTTSERYVDFIKRTDSEGYFPRTVQIPTHAVTRTHTLITTSCPYCKDDSLQVLGKVELMKMVMNLRKHIIER